MAFTVQFGTVYKKHNSTFRGASGSHWLSLPCVLKEESSVTNPSLFVDVSGTEIFSTTGTLNHAYISLYDRYYFVDNWTYERGKWRADLSVDVLATWRTSIGNSSQYILRCSATHDGKIFDSMYPVKNEISYTYVNASNPWTVGSGYYIIGIVSGGGMGLGAVGYYALTQSQFHSLMTYLFGNIGAYFDLNQIAQDITEETFKALYNPFQYIVSAMYIPFDMSGQGLSQQNIDVGYWTIPVTGGRINSLTPRNISLSMGWGGSHPKASRGSYVYCNPYTNVELDFQPFGHFQLPSDIVYDRGGVDITVKVDFITGRGTAYIGGLIAPYMTVEAQVGVPICISQMSTDYLATASSAVQSVGNTVSSVLNGDVGGAISNAVSGIDSTIRSQVPRLSTMGSNGGFASLVQAPVTIYTYYDIVDDDNLRLGRPLCRHRTINEIAGYILCENASVETGGTFEENQEISRLMNGGFYYE